MIVLLFIFIMNPINKYSFDMKAIQNLYLANSKDPSLFLPQNSKINIPEYLKNTKYYKESQNNYPVKLSM